MWQPENSIKSHMVSYCSVIKRFFTNVGPDLAKGIKTPANCDIYETMGDKNSQSIFLEKVSELELLTIVKANTLQIVMI